MDARVARTRRSLQSALFELAREHGLDNVTVGDIAAAAGVNRSTFYQHYSDKEVLLADALDLVAEEAGAQLPELSELTDEPPQALVTFLGHIDEHADLYRRVFTEPGYGIVLARLRGHIHDAVLRTEQSGEPGRTEVPAEVMAAGVAGAVVGVVGTWLVREPREDAGVASQWMWHVLVGPGGVDTAPEPA
ncbi:TetR/AcrR family transcriptional regulator [Demequina sediminicola]|uniref:TetR/AcrR family transcriptional regulator n=1 Tax=Demequina sediminicola TaxID=1095026 RepID=UPI0007867848|nr:TetR/AcrR family transcriptional regulator [Demequina sediminicola]